MKTPQYDSSRRTFLVTAAYALAGCAPVTLIGRGSTPRVLVTYAVPNSVKPVNIDKIVNALASDIDVRNGDYVPHFIDLANYIHHSLTGMTYPQHMEKGLGMKNPIEVEIMENLWESERGTLERFIHDPSQLGPNKAIFEAELAPAPFLLALVHGLGHSYLGPREPKAYAHEHRELSYAISKFPQLLRGKDSECLLTNIMVPYVSILVRESLATFLARTEGKDPKQFIGPYKFFPYFVLLSRDWEQGKFDINNALEEMIKRGVDLERRLIVHGSLKLDPEGNYLKSLVANFADKTERYILQHNSNFPRDKRILLRFKIEQIKNPRN